MNLNRKKDLLKPNISIQRDSYCVLFLFWVSFYDVKRHLSWNFSSILGSGRFPDWLLLVVVPFKFEFNFFFLVKKRFDILGLALRKLDKDRLIIVLPLPLVQSYSRYMFALIDNKAALSALKDTSFSMKRNRLQMKILNKTGPRLSSCGSLTSMPENEQQIELEVFRALNNYYVLPFTKFHLHTSIIFITKYWKQCKNCFQKLKTMFCQLSYKCDDRNTF